MNFIHRFLHRRAILKKANYLNLTPMRLLQDEVGEDNKVALLFPKFEGKLTKKYIAPMLKSPYIRMRLDEFGSAVWLVIDGKKKVQEIADELVQQFGDKIQPVEQRLTKFLTLLYTQKVITFAEIERAL